MAAGGAFAWGATTYTVGSGARMGPGYFPLMLGVLLAILGAVVTFKAMVLETEDGEKIGKWIWRPVGYIVAANLAFGVLLGGLPSIRLPAMGMVIAIIALTLISAKAGSEFILKEILILSAILVVGSYVTFILLLKLQIQVWPAFITG
jgi:hypothetical protein